MYLGDLILLLALLAGPAAAHSFPKAEAFLGHILRDSFNLVCLLEDVSDDDSFEQLVRYIGATQRPQGLILNETLICAQKYATHQHSS